MGKLRKISRTATQYNIDDKKIFDHSGDAVHYLEANMEEENIIDHDNEFDLASEREKIFADKDDSIDQDQLHEIHKLHLDRLHAIDELNNAYRTSPLSEGITDAFIDRGNIYFIKQGCLYIQYSNSGSPTKLVSNIDHNASIEGLINGYPCLLILGKLYVLTPSHNLQLILQ